MLNRFAIVAALLFALMTAWMLVVLETSKSKGYSVIPITAIPRDTLCENSIVIVKIDLNDEVTINGTRIERGAPLQNDVQTIFSKRRQRLLFLLPSKDVDYQQIVDVIDDVQKGKDAPFVILLTGNEQNVSCRVPIRTTKQKGPASLPGLSF